MPNDDNTDNDDEVDTMKPMLLRSLASSWWTVRQDDIDYDDNGADDELDCDDRYGEDDLAQDAV